jgi:hypothetical protein
MVLLDMLGSLRRTSAQDRRSLANCFMPGMPSSPSMPGTRLGQYLRFGKNTHLLAAEHRKRCIGGAERCCEAFPPYQLQASLPGLPGAVTSWNIPAAKRPVTLGVPPAAAAECCP